MLLLLLLLLWLWPCLLLLLLLSGINILSVLCCLQQLSSQLFCQVFSFFLRQHQTATVPKQRPCH